MDDAFETLRARLSEGQELRTPDKSAGKPFTIERLDGEGVTVRTSRGGRVRMSAFTFDSAVKFLKDYGCTGDTWLETKDETFQALLDMENDRVRAASYVLALLGAAGVVDLDGGRPNKVRLSPPPA